MQHVRVARVALPKITRQLNCGRSVDYDCNKCETLPFIGEFCWRCCRICEIRGYERFCKVCEFRCVLGSQRHRAVPSIGSNRSYILPRHHTGQPSAFRSLPPPTIDRGSYPGPRVCREESHICDNVEIRTRKTVSNKGQQNGWTRTFLRVFGNTTTYREYLYS